MFDEYGDVRPQLLKAAVTVLFVVSAFGWLEVWKLKISKQAPQVSILWQTTQAPDHLIVDGVDKGCKVYGIDSAGYIRWHPEPCKPIGPLTKDKQPVKISP